MAKPLSVEDMIPVQLGLIHRRTWILDINGSEVAFIKNLSRSEDPFSKAISFELDEILLSRDLINECIRSKVPEKFNLTIKGIDPIGHIAQMHQFHNAKLCQNGSSIHLSIQFESETLLY